MNSEHLPPNHETKAFGTDANDTHEVRHALDELMRAFDAFKQANNERLAQIDRRLSVDVVNEEKIHRLNETMDTHQKMLDDFAIAQQRPELDSYVGSAEREHKAAFDSYLRKGITSSLESFESKALTTATSSGGYIVPETVMVAVSDHLAHASPLRRLASVQQVSTSSFKKVLSSEGPGVRWATSETQDGDIAGQDGSFAERAFSFGRLVATPAATQSLLDDSAIDLEKWLADEIYIGFAENETEAFIKGLGDGPPSPKGFLRETIAAQAGNLTNDKIGYIASGIRNDWPADGSDGTGKITKLLELVYALKAAYRTDASWLMNKTSIAAIRSWTDGNNNPLWQPPTQPGAPATLLDYPVVEVEVMPSKNTANLAYPLAFGNWKRGYLIADRMDMRILRDPYSSKPNVVFYTTKTIGGGVVDHSAIKLLKCAAS